MSLKINTYKVFEYLYVVKFRGTSDSNSHISNNEMTFDIKLRKKI